MKIISKLKPLLSDLVSKKYIEGMKKGDPIYKYSTYTLLSIIIILLLAKFI